jgi:hypothetical protein
MKRFSSFVTTCKNHWAIVTIFAVLFIVFFISSVNTQRYLDSQIEQNQEGINDTKDFQYESRDIQNDYRNLTIEYLADINITLNKLLFKM